METRNKGFVIVGVVLLVIGLFASFYKVTHTVGQAPAAVVLQIVYPYQILGILFLLAGIVFMALVFLLPKQITQKTTTTSVTYPPMHAVSFKSSFSLLIPVSESLILNYWN